MTKKAKTKTKRAAVKIPARKTRSRAMTAKSQTNNPETAYAAALMHPFSEIAYGARVLDTYNSHTSTYAIKIDTTVTPAATSGDIIIFPNLALPIVSPGATSITGGVPLIYMDNTTVASARYPLSTSALATSLSNYRIVGMGIRVKGMSSATNAQGKFVIATIPTASWANTRNFTISGVQPSTDANGSAPNTMTAWGIPSTADVVDGSKLASFPGSIVVSNQDMCQTGYTIVPKMCDPEAFVFKKTNDQFIGFAYPGGGSKAGDASYLRISGFETTVISFQGGVTGNSPFDVEVIYHIEGAPNVNAAATSNIVSSSAKSPVNVFELWKTIQKAAAHPAVRATVTEAISSFSPLLGNFAKQALS